MGNPQTVNPSPGGILSAIRFWEGGRLFYNGVLTVVVMLWVVLTWPHFRPSLTLGSLEVIAVLALGANLLYCAAYVFEMFMQGLLPSINWRRLRQALWGLGTLLALVLENYWIADEIYPYPNDSPPSFFGGASSVPTATIASNMNFPAPLAVLGFLAASAGLFLALVSVLIFWFARKPKFARLSGIAIGIVVVIYFSLLFGFSAASRTTSLPRGSEKYFCEIDCHLAYSIVDLRTEPGAAFAHYVITLRTRFDETTTSPSRPKDAPLTPSPREVRLIDSAGHAYDPVSTQGTALLTPLKPTDSYVTELEFNVPANAKGLLLLINTAPGWADHVVIGDENSWLHKKTYFALQLPSTLGNQ